MRFRDDIEYKTDDQLRAMRRAGLVVSAIHKDLRDAVAPGITPVELDRIALATLEREGAISNFFGYFGYPAYTCISVNDTIVHGIPGNTPLEPGDIVSFDCGAIVDGWNGDAAFTVVLPGGDSELRTRRERLSEITRQAMWHGIAAMASGKRVNDIGTAIEDFVESLPDNVRPEIVEGYEGHGIGTKMHMSPGVANYAVTGRTPRLKPGMTLCIEPMLTAGSEKNHVLADEWTVKTNDGSDAAHWEHTIARHNGGLWVLTAPDGGAAELAKLGITIAPLD